MVKMHQLGNGNWVNLYQVSRVTVRLNGELALVHTSDGAECIRIEGTDAISAFMKVIDSISN